MNYDVNEVAFMDYVFDYQSLVKEKYDVIDESLSKQLFEKLANELIEMDFIDSSEELPFECDEFVTL